MPGSQHLHSAPPALETEAPSMLRARSGVDAPEQAQRPLPVLPLPAARGRCRPAGGGRATSVPAGRTRDRDCGATWTTGPPTSDSPPTRRPRPSPRSSPAWRSPPGTCTSPLGLVTQFRGDCAPPRPGWAVPLPGCRARPQRRGTEAPACGGQGQGCVRRWGRGPRLLREACLAPCGLGSTDASGRGAAPDPFHVRCTVPRVVCTASLPGWVRPGRWHRRPLSPACPSDAVRRLQPLKARVSAED